MCRLLALLISAGLLALLPVNAASAAEVTSITASRSYLRVDDWAGRDGVTLTVTARDIYGAPPLVVRNSAGAEVATLDTTWETGDPWTGTAQWRGYDSTARPVPAGLYTVRLRDESGESSAHATVRVQRLVMKTWVREPTPRYSKVRSFVGTCSALRSPSSRGVEGSLGYYSNTRCSVGEPEAIVATRHLLRLPTAARLRATTLAVYGGAAKSRPTSRAYVYPGRTAPLYLSGWVGAKVGSTMGWRAFDYVERIRIDGVEYAVWQVGTSEGHRYDVLKFRVTQKYGVWQ